MRAAISALLLLLAAACARSPGEVAVVNEVARQNARADQLMDDGDPESARRVLQDLIATFPDPLPVPLAQDVRFRLARLALAAGDTAAAVREAETGLALGAGRDLATANLLIVRAAALEGLGRGGEAASDYERALEINEALLKELLPPP